MKILLTCKTGITTNLLIERMEKVIKSEKLDITFKAVAETKVKEEVENFDIVLTGPQVSINQIKAVIGDKYPVEAIAVGDYTTLNAKHIIDDAMKSYKDFLEATGKTKEMSILISCMTGISSELIVSNMKEVAKNKNLHVRIKGVPETKIKDEINNFDVLLVGPQISISKLKETITNNIPMDTINTGFYTTINGEGILNQAAMLYNK